MKRNRKWLLAVCLAAVFGLTGNAAKQGEEEAGITAGKDEELVYAVLTSVVGNEISCTLTESGETKDYEIPVGTEVITRLGTTTTFLRLAEGNRVALLLRKGTGTIMAVQIVE